jgi:O-6-methylguanine DNA methyltransferase
MSPYHFHRVFKAITGLTPKAYADAQRANRMRDALAGKASVTAAIYDAGYGASSRFYERSGDILGMTATAYRNGGRDAEIRFAVGECSLGSILVARSAKGVCALSLGDDPGRAGARPPGPLPERRTGRRRQPHSRPSSPAVVGLVDNPAAGLGLPLDMRGTAFQQRVWTALQAIPPGQTVSYAELARRIGAPQLGPRRGRACAANAIAIAIPCHRVIRSDGTSRAIAGASSASARCWSGRRRHEQLHRVVPEPSPDAIAPASTGCDWAGSPPRSTTMERPSSTGLLTPAECAAIAGLYAHEEHFRSHVRMARHGFGRGEYRYFSYPLPGLVASLRTALYERLSPIANAGTSGSASPAAIPAARRVHRALPRRRPARGPPRCCCSTVRETSTACTRTSMATSRSRCRWRSCCRNRAPTSPAASSC